MKIVLIGYRGTGKSAVASKVAERLQLDCISMDDLIVEKMGMSISQIVATHGWLKFREMESALAAELSCTDKVVVDTGGGVIERPENMTVLSVNACVIWLKASVNVIVGRIEKATHRPALTQGKTVTQEVAEMLAQRTGKYRSAAHYEIDTDPLTVEQAADRVVAIWRELQLTSHQT